MRFLDHWRARVVVAAISAIAALTVASHSAVASVPVFTVTALDGLYVRSEPTRESTPLKLLPYLSQISTMECQLRVSSNPVEIWDKVTFEDLDQPGWVLDAFLTPGGGNDFNNLVPRCDRPPTGSIISPSAGSEVKPNAEIVVAGRFEDDRGIVSIDYFVSPGLTEAWLPLGRAAQQPDGRFTKRWTVSFPVGTRLTFAATVTDTGGNVVALTGMTTGILVTDRDQAPTGTMTSPTAGQAAFYGRPITLAATVTDDAGIDAVTFEVRDGLEEWLPAGIATQPVDDSFETTWTATVEAFRPGALLAFRALAVDAAGNEIVITGPNNVVVTQARTERKLSLRIVRFAGGGFGATGKLATVGAPALCRSGMVVRIQRWDDGEWVKAGRGPAVTNKQGSYTKRLTPDYAATFRAVVEEFTKADGNVCLAATSNKTHFGAGKAS